MNELIETITSEDISLRNRSIDSLLKNKNTDELLKSAEELEDFRKTVNNLYHKVRASLFLFVIYRFYLQENKEIKPEGRIPFEGVKAALDRNFEESINIYLKDVMKNRNLNGAVCSAIAHSYYQLAFKYLVDQVRLSISQCNENFYLFNTHGLENYPYSVLPELTIPDAGTGLYPVGMDATPVRLDPSHSGWSDIFFLGMDFPEGARVVNISVNLKVSGDEGTVKPPCECYCRFIEEPVISLRSIDLNTSKKISSLLELFNFGNDYLSLLKAGVVASGIVPPSFENKNIELKDILKKLLNKPGGIEVVSRVNDIPKGSRLAVSTTLLATIITCLMRFSGQTKSQTGLLTEEERRIAASRAILGEWLGGSGGGWQDSGGLWPGIKIITGEAATIGTPEFGVSRGCLLPNHSLFSRTDVPQGVEDKIINSVVLVHGGISQNVGPILEMVTEKYLLRYEKEWNARIRGIHLFDKITDALAQGNLKELGRLTTEDWEGPIQQIIPWANNAFTEDLINNVKKEFKEDYWGFLMLGGMSGSGMAFIIKPEIKEKFKKRVVEIMSELKNLYNYSLPFTIDPLVYDFDFNHDGNSARLLAGEDAKMPESSKIQDDKDSASGTKKFLNEKWIKREYGFDSKSHEHMKTLLRQGEIGLSRNRLPVTTKLEDVSDNEVSHFEKDKSNGDSYKSGMESLKRNEAAVVTFAGGMGSRWTEGAAVVKPINPFVKMEGKFRTFMEIHLAKSRKTGRVSGYKIPHVITTSYLTHVAIDNYLKRFNYFGDRARIYLSLGKSIGHRVYPNERDLRFLWEDQLQQKLDENTQKLQENIHRALIEWTKSKGEGEDYSENKPILRFNPPGHWYEIPNLIKNGVLSGIIKENPCLKYLFCHNIDTMGADIEPAILGMHISNQSCLSFEVTPRRIEDRGGGLAKINGYIQLIEGLALPREEDEYMLSYYNTLTNWITIDSLLEFFGLDRGLIIDAEKDSAKNDRILEAIQHIEKRMPTYVTIKNVKYVWGSGQEDVYPVAQFEKLWGDMTRLKDLKISYVAVPRYRGQQLKEPSQLDRWFNDRSFEYVRERASF
ncbi:MAG: UTP--glucose-1-phosphate uridylyltransferase [Nitrospirae bacterium]|nr:UTP--glucose-1-phosphate uridylyltransferase [Nitrospirota bacterium]